MKYLTRVPLKLFVQSKASLFNESKVDYMLNVIRARGATEKSKTAAEIGRLSVCIVAPTVHPSCSVVPIDFASRIMKGHSFLCEKSERESFMIQAIISSRFVEFPFKEKRNDSAK
jgi:hypothetical protein